MHPQLDQGDPLGRVQAHLAMLRAELNDARDDAAPQSQIRTRLEHMRHLAALLDSQLAWLTIDLATAKEHRACTASTSAA